MMHLSLCAAHVNIHKIGVKILFPIISSNVCLWFFEDNSDAFHTLVLGEKLWKCNIVSNNVKILFQKDANFGLMFYYRSQNLKNVYIHYLNQKICNNLYGTIQ